MLQKSKGLEKVFNAVNGGISALESESVLYGVKIITNLSSSDKFVAIAPIIFEYEQPDTPLKEKRGGFLSLLSNSFSSFTIGVSLRMKSDEQVGDRASKQALLVIQSCFKCLTLMVLDQKVQVNRVHLIENSSFLPSL